MSSSSTPRRRYDVFLSFRGEDTHDTFVYFLYKAFIGKGIHTFKGYDEIEAGKQVNAQLIEAIQESKCSVLIISENYASSSQCLNELVKILECKKTFGQAVYVLFYRVDPSDVRKQRGKFGEGFSDAVSKNPKNAQKWQEALEEIVNFKDWVYPSPGYGSEVDFIKSLTGHIFTKLKDTYAHHLEGLFGMTSQIEKVIDLLDLGSDEVRIVGLWGVAGLGKTTIAKAVYVSISWQFDGFSFVATRGFFSRNGLAAIQEKIISDTLKINDIRVASVRTGIDILRRRLCHRKVLIVLDDVDESIKIESLIGDLDWFSPGSRIIITTRDRQCLTMLRAADLYEVQEPACAE